MSGGDSSRSCWMPVDFYSFGQDLWDGAVDLLKSAADFRETVAKSVQGSDASIKIFQKSPAYPTPLWANACLHGLFGV